jgi:hypothetical protein
MGTFRRTAVAAVTSAAGAALNRPFGCFASAVIASFDLFQYDGLVTLDEVLAWLPQRIRVDFTCPGRGPHDWTPDWVRNVTAQYCRRCSAKKPIPGRKVELSRGSWMHYDY